MNKYNIKRYILILITIFLLSFIFSILTFLAEHKINPNFSIDNVVWWWLGTISTVGYGDIVPVTPLGKFFASFVILSSIIFIAIGVMQINNLFIVLTHKNELGLVKVFHKEHILIINNSYLTNYFIDIVAELFPYNKIYVFAMNKTSTANKRIEYIQGNPIIIEDLERANIIDTSLCIILPSNEVRIPDLYSILILSQIERISRDIKTLIVLNDRNRQLLDTLNNIKKLNINHVIIYEDEIYNKNISKQKTIIKNVIADLTSTNKNIS
ncbi:MAG: potassium channel family protein [Candidatus Dojkabacteria bacterium]|nr:potassium channel family protein [Candidatus Dojkabacteria bacterium]